VDKLQPYLPKIFEGFQTTAQIAAMSIVLAAAGAVILGGLRVSRSRTSRFGSGAAVELLRGTSVLVQLFWIYYALPLLPGEISIDPNVAAVAVLGLNGAAYGADIVRSGLRSVPAAQNDACHALGLPTAVAFFRVRLPQALSQIVPAFGSLAVDMAKWTSVVSFVTVQDVLYWGNTARAHTNETVSVYLLVGALYLVLCVAVAAVFRGIEYVLPLARSTRTAKRATRLPPKTLVTIGGNG
jgi:polar amino acid transport system permease protein